MQIKFYRIAANDPEEAAKELNGFLAAHKILTVQREFVQDGQGSFWAIAVEYLSSQPATEKKNSSRRKDYKKELPPETFGLYSKLREWRKSMAEQHGVPVYMVFTNEQLAAIASGPITTRAELQQVEGVGEAKIEKYSHIVEFVQQELGNSETPGELIS
jgi:superfamily II DNA helicase RecQ